tara:strand:+ start:2521 stop:3486 length:966 start_codon:yes stop_codon:yes gene_type:complete
MMYSIIIPFKELNSNLLNNLKSISFLEYTKFEVILVPDKNILLTEEYNYPIKTVISGKVMPGIKRDLGSKASTGDILAFIDDDAFPVSNWLNIASENFKEKKHFAIGGPGIDDSNNTQNIVQKLSDIFFKSKFFGFPERYMSFGVKKYFDDWPSVNLLIMKDAYLKVGGFDTNHWPGEDTILCSKLKKIGISILYVPELVVYHVRRTNLKKLFFQLFSYGYKRAIFFFEYPNNSRKIIFLIPTIFTIYLCSLIFLNNIFYIIPLFIYLVLSFFNYANVNKYNKHSTILILLFPFFCAYCHISYGIGYFNAFINKIIGYKKI